MRATREIASYAAARRRSAAYKARACHQTHSITAAHPNRWLPWASVPELDAFPPDVILKLKTYVYRLIDPRNSGTFYVGKARATGSSRTSAMS